MNDIILSIVVLSLVITFLYFTQTKKKLLTYGRSLKADLLEWNSLISDDEKQRLLLNAASKNIKFSLQMALTLALITLFVLTPVMMRIVNNHNLYYIHLTWESSLFFLISKKSGI